MGSIGGGWLILQICGEFCLEEIMKWQLCGEFWWENVDMFNDGICYLWESGRMRGRLIF